MAKVALIFGATGIVGSALAEHLASDTKPQEWKKIIITSRREPVLEVKDERLHFVSIDLEQDEQVIKKKLLEAGAEETTHVFFTAYIHSKTWDGKVLCEKNTPIFEKSIRAIDAIAPNLQRVVLQTGMKYYGVHLHPIKFPSSEDTPRHAPVEGNPNFYYEQEDFLVSFQQGKKWKYTTERPSNILGVTRGNGMSISPTLALYFLVQKELGKKALYPGNQNSYKGISDNSNAELIAQFAVWLSTKPEAENDHFNIIDHNSVHTTWEQQWKTIADYFGVEVEQPTFKNSASSTTYAREYSLEEYMADKRDVWKNVVKKHGGSEELWDYATWDFADALFSLPWANGPHEMKAVKIGWNKQLTPDESIIQVLDKLKRLKLTP